MHKIVNGVRIDLTKEEEEATIAEWEANRIKSEIRREEREKQRQAKELAQNKLAMLAGLTEEEKNLLFR